METVDVVVLGTGAAGLSAALAAHDAGARVALFEKHDRVGGTTGLSGGVAWLPINKYAAAAGVNDSRDEALAYLNSLSNGMLIPEMAEAFVDTAPEVIDWLEAATPLKLQLVKGYPDYHPEHPGGKPRGGRSLEPRMFAFETLGDWADKVTGLDNPMSISETPLGGGTGVLAPEVAAERMRRREQGCGRGLVGSLLKGCLDRGLTPRTEARAESLIVEAGDVTGVRFTNGEAVHARRGVVLATGGFEWDPELAQSFLRGPIAHPPSMPTGTGDGLRMAMRAGAMLGNMREAWWVPVAVQTGETRNGVQAVILVLRERTLPRSILVNRKGARFTNEAANYNALGASFHAMDVSAFDYANRPCWLIFDAGFVKRYGGFGAGPGGPAPEFALTAPSLAALGERIGLPAGSLERTVADWNASVAQGSDPLFGRGESAYDGWSGDQSRYPGKEATLGPIDEAPYYAVEIVGSCLGTSGGPRTTPDGAVIGADGAIISGLFAAGNAMASATGMIYGGAGGTIGPALVFGYRAGRAAARRG
jgi:succinate dehydrogenase/fumarate reductase flavoprotein subunit